MMPGLTTSNYTCFLSSYPLRVEAKGWRRRRSLFGVYDDDSSIVVMPASTFVSARHHSYRLQSLVEPLLRLNAEILRPSHGSVDRPRSDRSYLCLRRRAVDISHREPLLGPVHDGPVNHARAPPVGNDVEEIPDVHHERGRQRRHRNPLSAPRWDHL